MRFAALTALAPGANAARLEAKRFLAFVRQARPMRGSSRIKSGDAAQQKRFDYAFALYAQFCAKRNSRRSWFSRFFLNTSIKRHLRLSAEALWREFFEKAAQFAAFSRSSPFAYN
jgi:hypothetical protein